MTPSKRKRRSLFLPGFVLGFGMLMIASCSSVGIALGLNQLSLAELQGNGAAAWTPPPYTPAPTPLPVTTAAESSSAGSTRFAPQQDVRNLTNSRVNVRATPGYLSKPSGDVIGVIQPGATAVVLGENQASDNLVWWRVRVALDDGRTIEGWVAEATASGVQILGG
ncbi:MAG: SH3 domain-containing protein [Caldilinea sp.]